MARGTDDVFRDSCNRELARLMNKKPFVPEGLVSVSDEMVVAIYKVFPLDNFERTGDGGRGQKIKIIKTTPDQRTVDDILASIASQIKNHMDYHKNIWGNGNLNVSYSVDIEPPSALLQFKIVNNSGETVASVTRTQQCYPWNGIDKLYAALETDFKARNTTPETKLTRSSTPDRTGSGHTDGVIPGN